MVVLPCANLERASRTAVAGAASVNRIETGGTQTPFALASNSPEQSMLKLFVDVAPRGARFLTLLLAVAAGTCCPSLGFAQYIYGIDVSNYQGNVNWTAVKNSGTVFAFCKATEGVDFIDAKFTRNMTNASAAGVYVGPYHFGRINSNISNPNDAIDEANDFVDAIASYYELGGNYLRPVLDVENTPGLSTTAQNRAYISEWVRDFSGVVEDRLGLQPIIYCNTSYANSYFEADLTQYDLWIANYNYAPPAIPPSSIDGAWNGWDFWQYTDSGTVSGVSGNVDRNVYQGTLAEMLAEFQASTDAVPEPATATLTVMAFLAVRRRRR